MFDEFRKSLYSRFECVCTQGLLALNLSSSISAAPRIFIYIDEAIKLRGFLHPTRCRTRQIIHVSKSDNRTLLPDLKKSQCYISGMRMTRDLKRANGVAKASGALRRPAQQQLTLTCTRRCVTSLPSPSPDATRATAPRPSSLTSDDAAAGIVALAGYGEGTPTRTSETSGVLGWSSGAQRRLSVLGSDVRSQGGDREGGSNTRVAVNPTALWRGWTSDWFGVDGPGTQRHP